MKTSETRLIEGDEELHQHRLGTYFCYCGNSFTLAFCDSVPYIPVVFECQECTALAIGQPIDTLANQTPIVELAPVTN